MSIMNTYTGKKFDPLQMKPEDVDLLDIAHALSLLCRGGGHIDRFYTVALHSINCANEAKARGWERKLILACLLHDASEAYISDIIRPVKPYLTNYLEIEDQIMSVIWQHFQLELTPEEHKKWKQIDDEILDSELKEMFSGEAERIPAPLRSTPDFSERPHGEVEEEFIRIAEELLN